MTSPEIGQLIRDKRNSLQVSQQRLCEITGISVHALSNIESGKANPTVEVLTALCDALGLELVVRVRGA